MAAKQSQGAPRSYPLMPRAEIESLIAQGRNIVILDQHVHKVDAWMKYHPGGDKAIRHMVGRDATDEVNASVPPPTTPSLFKAYSHTN